MQCDDEMMAACLIVSVKKQGCNRLDTAVMDVRRLRERVVFVPVLGRG